METRHADTIDLDSSVELALALIAADESRGASADEECRGPHCPGELLDASGWPGERDAA
jgi:hypothetical protein